MTFSSSSNKRLRFQTNSDPFDNLPDDLLITILSKLCSTSSSPSDFINALIVCKRFNRLGLIPLVLSKASCNVFSIRAINWSDSAHRFVKRCVLSGNVEACYFLGMVRFYCLGNRRSGAWLLTKAAVRTHAMALYSLAVIQFNGSGGSKKDKDLRAGAMLCARATCFGNVDALRELGHCLQDGYGVQRNVAEGHRLLFLANARELAATVTSSSINTRQLSFNNRLLGPGQDPVPGLDCALLSDSSVHMPEPHPANRFLVEWFRLRRGLLDPDLGMCSHLGCGRPETRPHEFRRCSACGIVKYCSRGCQAHDWKLGHKAGCKRAEIWVAVAGVVDDQVVVMGGDAVVES